jgi:hypothetical protein
VSSARVLPYFLGPHGLVQLKNAVCEICVIKRKDATQWPNAIGSAQSSNRIRMRRTKFLARSNLLLYILLLLYTSNKARALQPEGIMLVCGRSSRRVRTILTSRDVVCASRISLSSARSHCRSYHACATPDLSCCSNPHLHPLGLCHHASCTTQTSPVVPSLTAIPSGCVVTPLTPSKPHPLSFALTVPSPRSPPHLPDLPSSSPRSFNPFEPLRHLPKFTFPHPHHIHIVSTIVHACNTL